MKTKLFFLAILSSITIYAQTQIGDDIDGEAAEDLSGHSVSISSNGNILAIGAPNNDGNGSVAGHVRVYQNLSGVWTQIGDDIDGEAAGDRSGWSVSLSSDGSILAIGAHKNDGFLGDAGHVRVYANIGGTWTQIGADIDGEAAFNNFGVSVSLSSDGSVVAIGASSNDDNGTYSGHVRVFQNISDVWTQIGADIDGEAAYDSSGHSVSLSSDGYTVAIGAHKNDGNGAYSGHVRIYEYNVTSWTQIGDDIDGEAVDDFSGTSVSLSSNGNTVAIGASNNDGNGDKSGHVRVYQNISGVWTQIGDDIDGEAAGDYSGVSVNLSSDGNIVVIGASGNDDNGQYAGQVRVYQNLSDVWTKIGQDIDGEAAGDRSGWSVSLSSDGSIVAIAALYNDGNSTWSGHVRIYDISALLSIENNEIAKNFTLYPNPVTKQLQIQVAPSLAYNKATIYNYFGQHVLQSKTTTIDVSSLAAGVYFIEVETNKGKGVKRFIKK